MKMHKMKDFSVKEALSSLEETSGTMTPESLTQQQAFALLMPGIRALREKKFSFEQVAELLGKIGFTLKATTVRTYYGEQISKEKQNGNISTKKTA